MKVKITWASDDNKAETKEFSSTNEMLEYAFGYDDDIILQRLSTNPEAINHVVDEYGRTFDYSIIIYDENVE